MIPHAEKIRRALYRWFGKNGRELPWRGGASAYAVLVSEFMLQQTTVAAVAPYFRRWMEAFPDVGALAAADEQSVLKLWEGLGYYSRARNLHKAAKAIVERFGGSIPCSADALRSLPGIGPYTAGAVAAFAFDQPVPVIDANIQRVLTRLAGFQRPIRSAEGARFLQAAASALLPASGGARHTAALMDLGATICRAGRPDCDRCPVKRFCLAEDPATLPVLPVKKAVERLEDRRAFSVKRGTVALVRSEGPRWRGLWLLPPAGPGGRVVAELDYPITRFRVHLEIVDTRQDPAWSVFSLNALPPMPSPHRRGLEMALGAMASDF